MLVYDRPSSFPPGGFVTVPTAALSLPPAALKVLLVALNWPPAARRRFSQRSVVAECDGLGREAVRTAFAVLVEQGWLSRPEGTPDGVYRLHAWSDDRTGVRSGRPTGHRSGDPSGQRTQTKPETPRTPRRRSAPAAAGGAGVWLEEFVKALPVAARPDGMPARLRAAAEQWAGHDPGAVADAVAASWPPQVRSVTGLLISKLDGGLSPDQVEHAGQRRVFASRRAAAEVGAADAVDADVAAGRVATIRAALAGL